MFLPYADEFFDRKQNRKAEGPASRKYGNDFFLPPANKPKPAPSPVGPPMRGPAASPGVPAPSLLPSLMPGLSGNQPTRRVRSFGILDNIQMPETSRQFRM